jgi:hypothetical protein
MAEAGRAPAKAKIGEERLRFDRIQDQKVAIVMSNGTRPEGLERFGIELDRAHVGMARRPHSLATSRFTVVSHTMCSRLTELFITYLDAVEAYHGVAHAGDASQYSGKNSALALALSARQNYWNHARRHGCREADIEPDGLADGYLAGNPRSAR